jgi:hypothetical protein
MVLYTVKHHQLVHDDAQLHQAHVSIEAPTKDCSVSFLAVIFVIPVLTLVSDKSSSFFCGFNSLF